MKKQNTKKEPLQQPLVIGRSELLVAFFNWAKEQAPTYRLKDLNTDLMVEHYLKATNSR